MLDETHLRRKIKRLSEAVWEQHASDAEVAAWLSSFSPPGPGASDERLQMLYLLSNFLYFGLKEIRELLHTQFRDLTWHPIISDIRIRNADTTDLAFIDQEAFEALSRTRFLGIGNPSESGSHLLYYFRQVNGLPSELFINHIELPGLPSARPEHGVGNVDRYIFIDDLCGTGEQAVTFSRDILRQVLTAHPAAQIAYHPLFATSSALVRIARETQFTSSACLMELDDSFKCFSDFSRIYADPEFASERSIAEAIARSYGSVLVPRHPLGYLDSQLAIGFSHNTPDNTLPIFWSDANIALPAWNPIFRRYQKIV